jgi:hypothetical protein
LPKHNYVNSFSWYFWVLIQITYLLVMILKTTFISHWCIWIPIIFIDINSFYKKYGKHAHFLKLPSLHFWFFHLLLPYYLNYFLLCSYWESSIVVSNQITSVTTLFKFERKTLHSSSEIHSGKLLIATFKSTVATCGEW